MSRIYVPTKGASDWKRLLAKPDLHWKPGFSAWAEAHSWEAANGIPPEIARLFAASEPFKGQTPELLLAIPEHQVPLPPKGGRPSQSDIFALIKAGDKIISTTVEGKVSESFGPTLSEWWQGASEGKAERIEYLCGVLGLQDRLAEIKGDTQLRYQLLHRAVSAIKEARRFNANAAAMVIHSFSNASDWEQEVGRFLRLFGREYRKGHLVEVPLPNARVLLVGGAIGQKEHRDGTEIARKGGKARKEVAQAYAGYLKAFNECDMAKIDKLVHYPLAHVADGETRTVWSFPFDPSHLKAKGWHKTVEADFEVVAVSETKAHVILRNARRLRRDGSLIETVSAFYAFMKTEGEWRIFAASAITTPA